MKIAEALVTSFIVLIIFSSCSSSRYGYIPKGVKQRTPIKKHVSKYAKKRNIIAPITVDNKQPQLPTVETNGIKKPIEPVLVLSLTVSKKRSNKKAKSINTKKSQPNEVIKVNETLKKQSVNQQQATQSSDFWEDLGEGFLFDLLGAIVLLALVAFFAWLESIGLGWIVVLIGVAVLVLIIIWLIEVIEDIFDMIFPSF